MWFGRPRRLRHGEFLALDRISLSIEPGQSVAIVGRAGSGKSTLARLIGGITQPSWGSVQLRGRPRLVRASAIGTTPQMKLIEYVRLVVASFGVTGMDVIARRSETVLDTCGLTEKRDTKIRNVASGELRDVTLFASLHMPADIYIFDGAARAKEGPLKSQLDARVDEIAERSTAIALANDPRRVPFDIDRAILIAGGRVIYDGALDAVATLFARLDYILAAADAEDDGAAELAVREVLDQGASSAAPEPGLEPLRIKDPYARQKSIERTLRAIASDIDILNDHLDREDRSRDRDDRIVFRIRTINLRIAGLAAQHALSDVLVAAPTRALLAEHAAPHDAAFLLEMIHRVGAPTFKFVQASSIETGGFAGLLAYEYGWSGLIVAPTAEPSATTHAALALENHVEWRSCELTPANIDTVIAEAGIHGDIDLLSLSVAGREYELWHAVQVCRPRIVLVAFDASRGPGGDAPRANPATEGSSRCGASLAALARLSSEKGFRLVGVGQARDHAIFVRADLLAETLPTLSPADCFTPLERRLLARPADDAMHQTMSSSDLAPRSSPSIPSKHRTGNEPVTP